MMTLKNVLVATDFSEPSDAAVMYGREFATRFGATLHILHVAPNVFAALGAENYAAVTPDLQQQVEDDAWRRLKALSVDSDNSGPTTWATVVTGNSPALAIVNFAKEHNIDLIVMGTHGRGAIAHVIMGNVAERVVRLAPCPVLTVRHRQHEFVRPDTLEAVAHA
jgi:nucleotide-binding universal stress UspA family protein